jgi:hypothetical protein
MSYAPPGTCRYCGCTEESPCRLSDGDTCSWINRERNVCSAPGCARRYYATLRTARPKKLAPWQVHERILEERRARRRASRQRKKGKAA